MENPLQKPSKVNANTEDHHRDYLNINYSPPTKYKVLKTINLLKNNETAGHLVLFYQGSMGK